MGVCILTSFSLILKMKGSLAILICLAISVQYSVQAGIGLQSKTVEVVDPAVQMLPINCPCANSCMQIHRGYSEEYHECVDRNKCKDRCKLVENRPLTGYVYNEEEHVSGINHHVNVSDTVNISDIVLS